MWFKFPEGTHGISVELQEFKPEYTDRDGGEYFRAPDHFAPLILGIPGFRATPPAQGKDVPVDLPPNSPSSAEAIQRLTEQIGALATELQNRDRMIEQLSRERSEAAQRTTIAEAKLADLQENASAKTQNSDLSSDGRTITASGKPAPAFQPNPNKPEGGPVLGDTTVTTSTAPATAPAPATNAKR